MQISMDYVKMLKLGYITNFNKSVYLKVSMSWRLF